jgi:teichoic acid transport system permease protein
MSLAEYAAQNGLSRVGARPPLRVYLADVLRRREFIVSLARFRLESENQRNRLGMAWIIIKPLLNAGVYGLIFGILLAGSRPANFIAFLVIGVFMFEFFASCFTSGSKSITANNALVQSLSFPRMALPMAKVHENFLHFVPTVVIMLVVVVGSGEMPRLEWLLLIPLIAIFYVFNAGLSLITARLTVHFRDLSQLLPFISRLIFYTTGIFFSVEKRFAEHPTVLRIADFQPIHEFLSLSRSILLTGPDYHMINAYWLYSSCWALAVFTFGVVFFWAAEERYGRTD